ncbi:NAD-dependent malic enzyme [Thermanaerosceptrum fracticalcis]|uniref:NAD-dependent malic enzyme n=1 Tax=Thermanaerosceptrum fracticalcis TaxID=1712410 RepID=A0A7G6E6D0_THEFR|nr:malic enzyme-like NAD(P)-binding protein [Thermanaerosceptrum fracticalcis]QNB47634.1 NAD-dependent malic enzyme [Thermanaerosceptrum fracticalcis]
MDLKEKALKLHFDNKGKIEVISKVPVKTSADLSLAYTPGVAEPCKEINKDINKVYDYTAKGNLVAVVTDGTAVLGLGDIGPEAGMPVMEGKAVLFKTFGGVDAFPICVATKEVDKIVEVVKMLEPTFGGVNLEDISAPRCFEIEERLKKETNIPIFHDDQHGTAVVVLAALINALKIVNKEISKVRIVVNGAGAAAIATVKLLISMGVSNVLLCDRSGIIYEGRKEGMNKAKEEIALATNKEKLQGSLSDALKDADVFIGLSGPGTATKEMIAGMNKDAIVMAMANPVPEIMPDEAKAGGAKVICTGRSDFPNQVNNVLAFPGIFRGALDVRATDINEEMKIAAAYAIAGLVGDELSADYVIPKALDLRVGPAVAAAVAEAAMKSGVARVKVSPEEVAENTRRLVNLNNER